MSELTNLSLKEIRSGLKSKSFSCAELLESYLVRARAYQDLNCFIEVSEAHARAAAKGADTAGFDGRPLFGVPVAVKDMILTKKIKTTAASKILSNFVPPYSATVVEKFEAAGAYTFGKTNLDEFAMGSSNENSFFGPVKNPWDKSRVPGGSSGGSAAAVAARLAPVALGTDTGGSIRQPAALCSVVGMKPTYGRVSRYGAVAFASSLDQIGGFASSVEDLAIFMNQICGHDPRDSTSVNRPVPDFEQALGKDIKGLKIGLPKEYFISGLQPEVEAAVKNAMTTLTKLGAQVVEITLPHTQDALSVYYILAPAEASSNLARYDGVRYGFRASETKDLEDLYIKTRSQGFGAEVKRRILIGNYVLSAGYYDAFYLRAQKVRSLIIKDFKDAFQTCDLIICPATPTTAFKIGEKSSDPLAMYLNDVFTIPVNLAGLPGMCVPCGFDNGGLPIGLQLIGKVWDEETLFKVAHAYQAETGFERKRPAIA